ncbi:MAG: OFA family MFS transporter [Erysipelothrix sp.]|jgi:MFS family permease|nr:OFA family MFS transporter [Erysipelothrix sp.]
MFFLNNPQSIKTRPVNPFRYIILGILIMLMIGTVYTYSVFRVALEVKFNLSTSLSGLPYMVALASYALFMLIGGKFVHTTHPRNMMLVGGFLVALGWILSSFTTNIVLFTLTYGLISGAGVGIVYGVPMAVVARWFPHRKGLVVGSVLIGFGLSPIITAPLASTLVSQFGVMNAFLYLGLGFLVLLPLLSWTFKYPEDQRSLQEHKHASSQLSNMNTKDMIRSKTFKGLYLNFILGTTIGLMLIGLTANVGIQFIGLETSEVSQWMALFAIFNGIGRPIFGWLTDRLDSRAAMLISYTFISIASLTLLFWGKDNFTVYILAFCIYWFNLGGWLAIAPTSTLRLYGMKNYSQNYGVVFTAYGFGAILGVLSSGVILDLFNNYQFVFIFIIALCCLGIIITKLFFNANSMMSKNQLS